MIPFFEIVHEVTCDAAFTFQETKEKLKLRTNQRFEIIGACLPLGYLWKMEV